jgi:hypothetical protein
MKIKNIFIKAGFCSLMDRPLPSNLPVEDSLLSAFRSLVIST